MKKGWEIKTLGGGVRGREWWNAKDRHPRILGRQVPLDNPCGNGGKAPDSCFAAASLGALFMPGEWYAALTEGVAQAKNYAGKLAVRFAYATNGQGIYEITCPPLNPVNKVIPVLDAAPAIFISCLG